MRLSRALLVPVLIFATGCSWFGGDDNAPEEIKPNPLPTIREEVSIDVLWSQKIGGGAGDRAIRLKPAVSGGRIYAAAPDGRVRALTTDSGREIWTVQVRELYTKAELLNAFSKDVDTITGGVGVGGDLVVLGTAAGEVVALNQSDGSLAWKAATSSEILSQPVINRDQVFVQSIDGKVASYDTASGERQWLYNTNQPSLTLRGTSTPVVFSDFVIAGFANGRVSFLDRTRGLATLDQRVAVAQGTTDLERLVDVDGTLALDDGKLFAASFQGRVVAIELQSGRMVWAEEASSVEGVGVGFGNVYLVTSDDQITALNANNGRETWNVDALLNRDLTAPVTIGSYIAMTDLDGYLHLLAQSDGRFVGRRKLDGSGVKGGVIAAGGRLFAQGDGGTLYALEVR